MSQALINQLLAQRESQCDFREARDGKPAQGVKLRRPPETEWGRFLVRQIAVEAMRDIVIDYAVGWYGLTEADLLGEGVGSSEPVVFSRELFAVVISDRADWVGIAFDRLLKLSNDYFKQRQEAEKN